MIMVLCLYVYAVTEYKLRKSLKEANDTVPSQTGKPPAKTNDEVGVLYVSESDGVVAAD
jgi:transposase